MSFLRTLMTGGNQPAINCFLLYHKCGNNYTINVHKLTRKTRYVPNVQIRTADRLNLPRRGEVVNFRCRNLDFATLEQHGVIARDDARFLVFTRHPASFILSATKYHHRGDEKWARTEPQPHLDGRSLTDALRATEDEGERQIITMTHFHWLYERMTSFAPHFDDPRFLRLRTEDLFVTNDPAYYQRIADFLRLSAEPSFVEALKQASPAFKRDLPAHSTGSFQHGNPLERLAPAAQAFYAENWQGFATQLDY